MISHQTNPKAIGIEQRWFPLDADQRAELRTELLERDVPRQQLAGVLEFVESQARGDVGTFSSATRARYRKILAGVAGVDPDGDQRPGLPLGWDQRQAGAADLRGLVLTGASAAAMLAAPIIYDPDGYVEPELVAA